MVTRGLAWWAEALREERYAFNEEELRPYFSLPKVLKARKRSEANRGMPRKGIKGLREIRVE